METRKPGDWELEWLSSVSQPRSSSVFLDSCQTETLGRGHKHLRSELWCVTKSLSRDINSNLAQASVPASQHQRQRRPHSRIWISLQIGGITPWTQTPNYLMDLTLWLAKPKLSQEQTEGSQPLRLNGPDREARLLGAEVDELQTQERAARRPQGIAHTRSNNPQNSNSGELKK